MNIQKLFSTTILILCAVLVQAQVTLFTESFESDGHGTRYIGNRYSDNIHDYFGVTDANGSLIYLSNTGGFSNAFSNFDGSQIYAGEDLDSDNPIGSVGYLVFATVDASSFGSLTISALLAANSITGTRYEQDDGIEIQYAFDGNIATGANSIGGLPTESTVNTGTYTTVGAYYGPTTGPPIGGDLAEDVDLDGPGGTRGDIIMNDMSTVRSFSFPQSGTNLSIRIKLINNTGSEEQGMDNIILQGFPPVPVELTHFTAKKEGRNSVILNWATASETNNRAFAILRSGDGQMWTNVDEIAGEKESNITKQYQYLDTEVLEGINYYKLKQTDFDGTSSFSDIQSVSFNSYNSIRLYPNPGSQKISIQSNESQLLPNEIEIYDFQQRLISRQKVIVNSFTTDELLNGVYLVRILFADKVVVRKLEISQN